MENVDTAVSSPVFLIVHSAHSQDVQLSLWLGSPGMPLLQHILSSSPALVSMTSKGAVDALSKQSVGVRPKVQFG